MAKLIAVCGAPHAGKTVLALRLSMEINSESKQPTAMISPDVVVPTLGLFFPHHKENTLYSIGAALDRPDVNKADILASMNFVKGWDNLSILGYKTGENRYSYSVPTQDRAMNLLRELGGIVSYMIVDCTNAADDVLSIYAREHADQIISVIAPDLPSVIYHTGVNTGNSLRVMNITDNDVILPVSEIKAHFGDFGFTVPYSHALRQQWVTGTLTGKVNDSRYQKVVRSIAKAVL